VGLQFLDVQVHPQAGPLGEVELVAAEVERVVDEAVVVAVVGDVVLQPVQVRDVIIVWAPARTCSGPIALCGLIGTWYASASVAIRRSSEIPPVQSTSGMM